MKTKALLILITTLCLSCADKAQIYIDNPTNDDLVVIFNNDKKFDVKKNQHIRMFDLEKGKNSMQVDGGTPIEFEVMSNKVLINPTLSPYYIYKAIYSPDQSHRGFAPTQYKIDSVFNSVERYNSRVNVMMDSLRKEETDLIKNSSPAIDLSILDYGIPQKLPKKMDTTKKNVFVVSKIFRKIDFVNFMIEDEIPLENLYDDTLNETSPYNIMIMELCIVEDSILKLPSPKTHKLLKKRKSD